MSLADAKDVMINTLTLRGQSLSTEIADAIVSAQLIRSFDSAPNLTITLEDPAHTILQSGLFAQRIDIQIDNKGFELAAMKKQGNKLILTFEDLAVAEMRKHTDIRQLKGVTRVQFAQMLMLETPWIPFYPPPGVNEPVAQVTLARGVVASDSGLTAGDPGYYDNATTGAQPDAKTESNAIVVAQAALAAGFTGGDLVTMVAIAQAESGFRAGVTSHSGAYTYYGLWQIQSSHTNLLKIGNWSDPAANAKMAYELYKASGGPSGSKRFNPWETYTTSNSKLSYRQFLGNAQFAVSQIGVDTAALSASQQNKLADQTLTGQKEDTWTCLKRIFAEVGWRIYVDWNQDNIASVYVGPDSGFLSGPIADNITEQSEDINTLDWDFDLGKIQATARFTGQSVRWAYPPGTPVNLTETGLPNPWLVSTVTRDLFSAVATVDLKRPEPELPEPVASSNVADALANYYGADGGGTDTSSTSGGGGTGDYIWPVSGTHNITTKFGAKSAGTGRPHQGIDIAIPSGTPVFASRDGVVDLADGVFDPRGYGNLVRIVHRPPGTDDVVGPFAATDSTYYGHLSVIGCRRGMSVKKGQLIGQSGGIKGAPGSGDATGPHLHFEIRKNGTPVDPLPLLSSTGKNSGSVTTTGPLGPQGIQTR